MLLLWFALTVGDSVVRLEKREGCKVARWERCENSNMGKVRYSWIIGGCGMRRVSKTSQFYF